MPETKAKPETKPETEAGNAEAKAPETKPGTDLQPLKGGATGEPVQPTDPRAKAEIDAMLEQIVGAEPSAQEILQAIVGGEDLPESSAQQSQAGIVARILASEDATGVLDMGEPTKAEDLEQVELDVSGVRWMRSTFDEGPGVYAVIDAVRVDNGEATKVTCGSVNVMTQLLRLQTMAAFPQRVKIVKSSRPTKSGYYPYWLQPA
jgi:hypothetical protein